jgi:lipopolysaccharide transport system permease protein
MPVLAQDEQWDIIIQPKKKLLDLNLSEVWKYRDLMWLFVRRDFVATYKQTVLGPLWHFISPIFSTIIFVFVFGKVAKISTDGIPLPLFYLSGIIIWNYFSGCLNNTSNTFVANATIFGKVYFPRLIIPMSNVMSVLIKFAIQFAMLITLMLYYYFTGKYSIRIGWNVLIIPVLLLLMAGIGLGTGIIISSLTTKYRDMTVLIGFGVQLLMYASPVIYPLSAIDNEYRHILMVNPLTGIIECFRFALFGVGDFSVNPLVYSASFMTVVILIGLLIFNRVEKTFMDTV